jgi:hypothetical protein
VPVLRARTSLSCAALVFALALWASPAGANQTIGGACTTGTADAAQSADGNNVVCNGSVWQYPAYQHGNSTASCNATNAGIVKYTSSTLYACNGSSWIPIDDGERWRGHKFQRLKLVVELQHALSQLHGNNGFAKRERLRHCVRWRRGRANMGNRQL